jgi:hypothetical protein
VKTKGNKCVEMFAVKMIIAKSIKINIILGLREAGAIKILVRFKLNAKNMDFFGVMVNAVDLVLININVLKLTIMELHI